jgi:hypothetical protein
MRRFEPRWERCPTAAGYELAPRVVNDGRSDSGGVPLPGSFKANLFRSIRITKGDNDARGMG